MTARATTCQLGNRTARTLVLAESCVTPAHWLAEPPATIGPYGVGQWIAQSPADDEKHDIEGYVVYRLDDRDGDPIWLYWNDPLGKDNVYDELAPADVSVVHQGDDAFFAHAIFTVSPAPEKSPAAPAPHLVFAAGIPGDPAPAPTTPGVMIGSDPDPKPNDHRPIPLNVPSVIVVKPWLIDVAWQALNQMEWSDLVMEISENRHGNKLGPNTDGGMSCPGKYQTIDGITDYSKEQGCTQGRCVYNGNFYSWCGDFVSWMFWKGWQLNGKRGLSRETLAKFLNRKALRGTWSDGQNIVRCEDFAKGGSNGLLGYHPKGDGYVPAPGDVYIGNRPNGDHIGVVSNFNGTWDSLDGKGWDDAWLRNAPPGVRVISGVSSSTGKTLTGQGSPNYRAFIDTSAVRYFLGYK